LSRYIHLNPLFAGLVKKAEDWEFSSYRDYLGGRIPEFVESIRPKIPGTYHRPPVATEYILSHFDGIEDYRKFVESLAEAEMRRIDDQLWTLDRLPESHRAERV
jgi:hypothetical protein